MPSETARIRFASIGNSTKHWTRSAIGNAAAAAGVDEKVEKGEDEAATEYGDGGG